MIYLFTYKDGKKPLGLSNTNRGLALKAGNKTVYPLLVSTSAYNASCVRTKVNGTIKSLSYVPSLIIPVVLCSKIASTYIDPTGINFSDTFYSECYFDNKYGEYVARSKYTGIGADKHSKIAISIDGKAWVEKTIMFESALASTNSGVVVFEPSYEEVEEFSGTKVIVKINARVYYRDGNTIKSQTLLSFKLFEYYTVDTFNILDVKIATNGNNIVTLYYRSEFISNGNTHYMRDFYCVNVSSKTVTTIGLPGNEYDDIIYIWYNKILNKFFYDQRGYGIHVSSNGSTYTYIDSAKYSYGNLNGAEVFADGISYNGTTVAKSYTYRPNAYDPVEGKYIRVATNWRATGQGPQRIYYVEVYESTNLNSWTKVKTKENPTVMYPQTLQEVNTDGFACVKGL